MLNYRNEDGLESMPYREELKKRNGCSWHGVLYSGKTGMMNWEASSMLNLTYEKLNNQQIFPFKQNTKYILLPISGNLQVWTVDHNTLSLVLIRFSHGVVTVTSQYWYINRFKFKYSSIFWGRRQTFVGWASFCVRFVFFKHIWCDHLRMVTCFLYNPEIITKV